MKKITGYLFLYSFTLLSFLILYSCSNKNGGTKESNYLYDDRIKEITPAYFVYHENDDLSQLYFQVKSNELLYVRENVSQPFEATVKIVYKIYNTRKQKVLIDSATNMLVDIKTSSTIKKITGKIPLNIAQGGNYVIRVEAYDVNKRVKSIDIIEINKVIKDTRQYFLLSKKNNEVCFNNYFSQNEELIIQSNFNDEQELNVKFYEYKFEKAKPPFSTKVKKYTLPETPDSLLSFGIASFKGFFNLFEKGTYSFNMKNKQLFVLNYLEENFPEIINHEGMVEPLRYICTNKEYAALIEATDKKQAVEDFWIKMSGSKERAKTLIREYYSRLYLANKHFSSYKEGWKTDRGMLSIVMGSPNTINKTNQGETWLYGTSHNMMMALSFSFYKQNKELHNNDYKLDRYRLYKDYWFRAVESWRRGRVYTFN